MIVAEQMDQAMNKQSFEFNGKRVTCLIRLARCNRNGDHNIAEHVRLNMEEATLTQRERQDVSGLVLVTPSAIERAHGPVADEQNAQLGVRKTEAPEQLLEPCLEKRCRQPSFSQFVCYPDVHSVSFLR